MKFLYGLLLICLMSGLYTEWLVFPTRPPHILKPSQITAQIQPSTTGPLVAPAFRPDLHPRTTYELIAKHTLFSASRKPDEPETQQPEKILEKEQTLDGLELKAILINSKGKTFAMVKDPQLNKSLRLAKGDKLRGWDISNIGKENLELLSPNGKSFKINLRVFRPAGTAAKSTPPINPGAPPGFHPSAPPGMPPNAENLQQPYERRDDMLRNHLPIRPPHQMNRRPNNS